MPNRSRRARLEELEKYYTPHILANFRFITHVTVSATDPRCGTYEHKSLQDHPIKELIIYTETREAYTKLKKKFEQDYTLMEG